MRETLVKTEDFKDSPLGKIPADWEVLTFEDVSTVRQGLQIAISRRFKDYKPGRYIYITVEYLNNIANSNILEFIESPGNRVICQEDDVLVTRTGATGKIITGVEGVFHNNFFLVDYDRSKVNRHYLVYYLNLEQIQKEIRLRSGTTTIPDLKHRDFYSLTFLRPPLTEQEEIAVILKTCDEAIAHTSSLIAKLKQMKAGLLHDLLTRGLDENGELRDAIVHPEQFKDSPLGQIPKDWGVYPLKECVCRDAQITYGIVQAGSHVEGGVPYIRTGDMAGDRLSIEGLLRTSPQIAASYHRSKVRTGEIVCAIRATVGKVLEVPPELDGANLTQGTARIAPREDINNHFLLWALRSTYVQRQFDLAVKGTTFSEITLENLREIKVALPLHNEEQDKIAEILDSHDTRIRAEEVYRDKLKLQKQGLMHDLLTGKVRVKNA